MIDINAIALRIAKKAAPTTLFEKTFADVAAKAKNYATSLAQAEALNLEKHLTDDLKKLGYDAEVKVSLGRFRGHLFITSALVFIPGAVPERLVDAVGKFLINMYSPKFRYKGLDDGRHKFNVR